MMRKLREHPKYVGFGIMCSAAGVFCLISPAFAGGWFCASLIYTVTNEQVQ